MGWGPIARTSAARRRTMQACHGPLLVKAGTTFELVASPISTSPSFGGRGADALVERYHTAFGVVPRPCTCAADEHGGTCAISTVVFQDVFESLSQIGAPQDAGMERSPESDVMESEKLANRESG